MSSVRELYSAAVLAGLMAAGLGLCAAQTPAPPSPDQSASAPATPQPTTPVASSPATPAAPAEPAAPAARSDDSVGLTDATPAKKSYTVPAGTKVLLELRSAINTKSAKPGDGVYLSSTFPVVVGNRVMIPTGVYVQGMVDRVQRGGMRAKAQLDMHFTSIIFPNGTVAEIPGVVDSVPGSKNQTVMNDGEGTIQQNGDKGRNAGQAAEDRASYRRGCRHHRRCRLRSSH
jgi:hypothetical protein